MIPSEWWEELAAQHPADVTRRAGAHPAADGSYRLDILNQVYRIDAAERCIERIVPPAPSEPDLHCALAAVVYLTRAQDIALAGEWVSPRQLPGGYDFFSGPHEVPVDRIIQHFGADKEGFERGCQTLGGHPEPFGDAGYSFSLFPRLPVAILLWLEDEEFPARATMLVDRRAHRHFPLDALWAGFHVMENALIDAGPV